MIIAVTANPLVHVNALLNAVAAVLLLVGLVMIKSGRVTAHKRVMLSAFAVSVAFLACYVWYHYQAGHVRFTHPGAVRYVYLSILASHVLLAVTVPVLAVWAIYLGLRAVGGSGDSPLFAAGDKRRDDATTGNKGTVPAAAYRQRHRRLVHWAFPIWLYVSVTGVVVYVMLYHLWPPA